LKQYSAVTDMLYGILKPFYCWES